MRNRCLSADVTGSGKSVKRDSLFAWADVIDDMDIMRFSLVDIDDRFFYIAKSFC